MLGAGGALLGMKVAKDPVVTLFPAAAGLIAGHAIDQRCPSCAEHSCRSENF